MARDSSTSQFDPDPDSAAPDPGPVDALPTNEREYIIPAQDAKGHHTRLYCRTIPAVGRMVADIHASKKYPFRTVGDVVRWCIVYGAKRLLAGIGIKSVMVQADAMIALLQDEEFQLQFAEVFAHMQRVINAYVENNAAGEARRVVATMRAQIESMPESFWKQKYLDELLRRYSSLLDAPGVAPGAFDLEPEPELDLAAEGVES